MSTYYISIGNGDDKLSQARWALFVRDLLGVADRAIELDDAEVHGVWYSDPSSPFQNMCICLEIGNEMAQMVVAELRRLAAEYEQESISLARVDAQAFVSAVA